MKGQHNSKLSIFEQCKILQIAKSTYYENILKQEERQKAKIEEMKIFRERSKILIDVWTEKGFSTFGYQKMSKELKRRGFDWANEKNIRILYKRLGLRGLRPSFKTTKQSLRPYAKFPYLLRYKKIRYVNQVWATDITYIKTKWGMMYFTAVIDLYSRKILSWRLSNNMKVDFCLEAIQEAIVNYGVPAILNTDCGSQYTSKEFVELLKSYDIQISMDGIGRCKDNIFVERTWRTLKYEWIFFNDFRTREELQKSLNDFVIFFNEQRIHQGLNYMTPNEIYKSGTFSFIENSSSQAA